MGNKHKQRREAESQAMDADAPTVSDTAAAPTDPISDATAASTDPVQIELKGDAPAAAGDAERDVGKIDVDSLPERPSPLVNGPRLNRFQAVIKRSVLKGIARHGATKPDVEVCGVLVGNLFRDRAGPFLYVESIVRGDFAANKEAQVTFTAQTWQHIQEQMDLKHPEQKILGWYHTHPGFGIFLSKMDLFIHENFFNLPWQTAFVYDPKSREEGLFVWHNGLAEREDFLVEEDTGSIEDAVETQAQTAIAETAVAVTALAEIKSRLRRLEKRNRSLMVAIVMLALLAAAWPFVLFTIMTGNGLPLRIAPKRPPAAATTPATKPVIASMKIAPKPRVLPATLPSATVQQP